MVQNKIRAKALLIDLDGTLVDSVECFSMAMEVALSQIGHVGSHGEVGVDIARILQRNLPLGEIESIHLKKELRDKFLTSFSQSFCEIASYKTKLLPNVEKTLRVLSTGFLLALITRRRSPEYLIGKELKRLQVSRYFTAIVTSLQVERATPFPDAILLAAKKLEVPIEYCVVVSDSGVDIQAGKLAGARTVAVLSGLFKKEELKKEKPDLIIEDVTALPNWLLQT